MDDLTCLLQTDHPFLWKRNLEGIPRQVLHWFFSKATPSYRNRR